MIIFDYLEQGCTINGAYNADKLRRPRQESKERGEEN